MKLKVDWKTKRRVIMLEELLLDTSERLVLELGGNKRPEENEKREVRLEFWKGLVKDGLGESN